MSSRFQTAIDTSVRAVDGNTEQRMRSCTMTASGQQQVWWQVDLGTERSVSHVTVYYQTSLYQYHYYQYIKLLESTRNVK